MNPVRRLRACPTMYHTRNQTTGLRAAGTRKRRSHQAACASKQTGLTSDLESEPGPAGEGGADVVGALQEVV